MKVTVVICKVCKESGKWELHHTFLEATFQHRPWHWRYLSGTACYSLIIIDSYSVFHICPFFLCIVLFCNVEMQMPSQASVWTWKMSLFLNFSLGNHQEQLKTRSKNKNFQIISNYKNNSLAKFNLSLKTSHTVLRPYLQPFLCYLEKKKLL